MIIGVVIGAIIVFLMAFITVIDDIIASILFMTSISTKSIQPSRVLSV